MNKKTEKLELLDSDNLKECVNYHILYLDKPYNYDKNPLNSGWIDREIISKHLIFSLDSTIFEEILTKTLIKYEFYDCFLISDFTSDNLLNLLNDLIKEQKNINSLTESEFYKKYIYVLETIYCDDFIKLYDKAKEYELVKKDINTIFEVLITHCYKGYLEDKSLTIVGI